MSLLSPMTDLPRALQQAGLTAEDWAVIEQSRSPATLALYRRIAWIVQAGLNGREVTDSTLAQFCRENSHLAPATLSLYMSRSAA